MRYVAIILALSLLLACTTPAPDISDSVASKSINASFLATYNTILELDKKYNGSFREEKLIINPIDKNNITDYIKDVQELQEQLKLSNHSQKSESLDLLRAREHMLLSQKAFHNALKNRKEGGFANGTINCSDKRLVAETVRLLQDVQKESGEATSFLDKILQNHEYTREILGLGDNRIEFYDSSFVPVQTQIKRNLQALSQPCKS